MGGCLSTGQSRGGGKMASRLRLDEKRKKERQKDRKKDGEGSELR